MSDICVRVEGLSKTFRVFTVEKSYTQLLKSIATRQPISKELPVLRDISFEVRKGEKLAVIGKNGSGKTTLLRILAGIYDETAGRIRVEGNPMFLFNFGAGFNMNLSVVKNIYLCGVMYGLGRDMLRSKESAILETADLSGLWFLPLRDLSGGQRKRLALSIFFQVKTEFMILDEALAATDRAFVQKCDAHIQNLFSPENTVIVATHDMSFIKNYCRRAIWLDEGCVKMAGTVGDVVSEYERFYKTPLQK